MCPEYTSQGVLQCGTSEGYRSASMNHSRYAKIIQLMKSYNEKKCFAIFFPLGKCQLIEAQPLEGNSSVASARPTTVSLQDV